MKGTRHDGSREGVLRARPGGAHAPATDPGPRSFDLSAGRGSPFYVPQAYDPARPAPLLLMLHGAGGSGADVAPLVVRVAEQKGCLLLLPDSREATWDVIVGEYGPDVEFIDDALRQTFESFTIDPRRIAIAGFSDGASYALSLGIINGALFSHILAFSPGFMAPTARTDAPRIFVSHGTKDEVLPIERCSRRLVPLLKRAGYDVEYAEFDGGHAVPPEIVWRAATRFLD